MHSDELSRYCEYLLRVLEAAFAEESRFSATIFSEEGPERLAVRLAAIHLRKSDRSEYGMSRSNLPYSSVGSEISRRW